MKNLLLTTVAVFSLSTAAFAEEAAAPAAAPVAVLSGEVSLDFAETAAGDIGGSLGVDLDVTAGSVGTVALGFVATDGNAVELDTWTVGTTVGAIGLAFGDDNSVFVEAEGEHTIAAPAMAESLLVSVGDAQVAIGFTDWTADITDVSNVQGAYTVALGGLSVKAAADYNLDSKNTVLGAEVAGLEVGPASLGGAVTYDTDASLFAYEGVARTGGLMAYVNGDQDDAFQNVGGEYEYLLGGAALTAGLNYDVNAEDVAPTVGVTFAF